MKVAKDRKYTDVFRTSAVSQVLEGGRRQAAVARSLDISVKTLANWVGKALTKGARAPILPSTAYRLKKQARCLSIPWQSPIQTMNTRLARSGF